MSFTPFSDSLILNNIEAIRLYNYIKQSADTLLYRGSRDGISPQAFHSKCDGKANTVTIIKTDKNYVFGGYTASPWKSERETYGDDPTAFIFSLRKNGTSSLSSSNKFTVRDAGTAIYNDFEAGPVFGSYKETYLADLFVSLNGPYQNAADFGSSYNTGTMSPRSSEAKNYLAGQFNLWILNEIEVYQIFK
jgi:hypothetical protein